MEVKNSPEAKDYADILLDIVGEHFEQAKSVTEADRAVYNACLSGIASADELNQLEPLDLRRLQEAPTILNLRDQPTHPDELLLQDSEWHAGFFSGELDPALCKPAPELWPLLEKVGVKRLSECAAVALEFVDGPWNPRFRSPRSWWRGQTSLRDCFTTSLLRQEEGEQGALRVAGV